MPEVTDAGEDHGETFFVGRGDDLGIALRPARLNHGRCAGRGGGQEPVRKGKERIRRHHLDDVVALLAERGAALDARNENGQTPLGLASGATAVLLAELGATDGGAGAAVTAR